MAAPTSSEIPSIVHIGRILPDQPASREFTSPLSLLDATTANFSLTSAIWLLDRPNISLAPDDLTGHLRAAFGATLNAYQQWCGFLKSIITIDSNKPTRETAHFPTYARRYGRVYVHYGTVADPGVEFVEATSLATVDSLYSVHSAKRRPIWNRLENEVTLSCFVPQTAVVNALQPNEKDANGSYKPCMAVQLTRLACGGFVIAAKIAHPLADITALTLFRPDILDAHAAGDINASEANPTIVQDALALPLHRYDWWAPPMKPPSQFSADLAPAGKPLPWAEWDTQAKVEQYTIHLSQKQIDFLWQSATQDSSIMLPGLKVSKHDALLAHIWSCVVRARGLQEDQGPVHCDLVLGTRPVLKLGAGFIGSPTMMLNIESTASQVASTSLGKIAQRIRETLMTVNDEQRLAAHLHSIAYEKSPQRIWQGFLGQRHIMVTTWARAGMYEVDFGFGALIRYADGVVPCLDGCILINDAPPTNSTSSSNTYPRTWTDNGVDVTLPLLPEDMKRLLQDPLLLPEV
ncbi:transferase family-domain-containing protein [Bipolaris maydis]|nr:transferase family-domain-containing protein [Bipolaris maydis]